LEAAFRYIFSLSAMKSIFRSLCACLAQHLVFQIGHERSIASLSESSSLVAPALLSFFLNQDLALLGKCNYCSCVTLNGWEKLGRDRTGWNRGPDTVAALRQKGPSMRYLGVPPLSTRLHLASGSTKVGIHCWYLWCVLILPSGQFLTRLKEWHSFGGRPEYLFLKEEKEERPWKGNWIIYYRSPPTMFGSGKEVQYYGRYHVHNCDISKRGKVVEAILTPFVVVSQKFSGKIWSSFFYFLVIFFLLCLFCLL